MDTSSRYSGLPALPVQDSRTLQRSSTEPWDWEHKVTYAVFRFPTADGSGKYRHHRWLESDRWDLIAVKYLGASSEWWKILDVNPQVQDPLHMEAGQMILVPIPEKPGTEVL